MTFANVTILLTAANQRAAFVVLIVLVVGAGIPLAFAWARILPEDAPPFKIEPGSFPSVDLEPTAPARNPKRDPLSIALLLCVTITYLVRFPGMPVAAVLHWLDGSTSGATVSSLLIATRVVLLVGTGLAACIAAVRSTRLRAPLIAAAGLTLLLWLLGPILQIAMLSTN
jgi:hypothetical protein